MPPMSHRSCGPLIAVWIANVYLVKNIEKVGKSSAWVGQSTRVMKFWKKHLVVNEGEMSSKNSFKFGDSHVLKCETCCLRNHSCCSPGGAWRTVFAGWRKRPGCSTLPPPLYNRWSTLFQACRCPKTRLFLDFFWLLYVVSPWWNIRILIVTFWSPCPIRNPSGKTNHWVDYGVATWSGRVCHT